MFEEFLFNSDILSFESKWDGLPNSLVFIPLKNYPKHLPWETISCYFWGKVWNIIFLAGSYAGGLFYEK